VRARAEQRCSARARTSSMWGGRLCALAARRNLILT